MRGRKPSLQVIDGGFRPKPAGKVPKPPEWLSRHAKAEWRRAAPELHARAMLTKDTVAALESYCIAYGTVRELEVTLQEDGRVLKSDDGSCQAHPAFRMQTAAMREARLLAAELGLTPHRKPANKAKGAMRKREEWDGDADLLA